jgi:hypothetical protein
MLDLDHPHARFREDVAARLERERREDRYWMGVCVVLLLVCLGLFIWMVRTSYT